MPLEQVLALTKGSKRQLWFYGSILTLIISFHKPNLILILIWSSQALSLNSWPATTMRFKKEFGNLYPSNDTYMKPNLSLEVYM